MTKLEKWQAEAAAQGWVFVAKIDGHYGNYTHNACGHGQTITTSNMGKGKVQCFFCKTAKRKVEAHAQGWVFVAQVDKQYAKYTHAACGQSQHVHLTAMRAGRVQCQRCKEQAWRDEAATQGWVFECNVDKIYASYKHVLCGHVQQVQFGHMRVGGVRCRGCETAKWKAEATAQGWTFDAQVADQYGGYTHVCGHWQKVPFHAMRNGHVACHACGESWATKPSNVYLLDITTACGQRFLKLGIARIVTRRAQEYGLVDGAKIKVLYTKAYATGAEACKVEKKLHKTATKIHPSIRKFKGAKKLMDSGYTECYEYSPEAVNYLLFTLQF